MGKIITDIGGVAGWRGQSADYINTSTRAFRQTVNLELKKQLKKAINLGVDMKGKSFDYVIHKIEQDIYPAIDKLRRRVHWTNAGAYTVVPKEAQPDDFAVRIDVLPGGRLRLEGMRLLVTAKEYMEKKKAQQRKILLPHEVSGF